MSAITIIGVVISATFFFYLIFLAIGFSGISQNRKAQELDDN